jgi:hypothetical protein
VRKGDDLIVEMGSLLGKRKRGGLTAAPISALAARKARQTAPPVDEAPAPAAPPPEKPAVEAPDEASSEASEAVDDAADATVAEEPQSRGLSRYFAHAEAPQRSEVASERPAELSAPVSRATSPPAEATTLPRTTSNLDPQCASTWQPRAGENLLVDGETSTVLLAECEVRLQSPLRVVAL